LLASSWSLLPPITSLHPSSMRRRKSSSISPLNTHASHANQISPHTNETEIRRH
jgi:hypothetical protein